MKDNNITSTQNEAFEKEYCDTLNRLGNDNRMLKGLRWFLDTAYNRAYNNTECTDSKSVVILGTSVPEELVIAAGAEPQWIIGGSLASTVWSDELVPRDTDPVSRSVLGYINRPDGSGFSDTLFIIPLVSDSMRKIAYELKSEGRNICLVDIPPDRNDTYSVQKYAKQMKAMCSAVSEHTKARVTRRSLVSAMKLISAARRSLHRFLEVSRGRTDIITDAARLFVRNSYYMTSSIVEWTRRLEVLTGEIEFYAVRMKNNERNRPCIMLLGSPVIFPNYKIPFLTRESGLAICDTADYITLKTNIVYGESAMRGRRDRLIENIAEKWYAYDSSPSFVKNDVLFGYVSWIIQKGYTEGIIYHVLKGQIEYDFELERFENMLAEYGIPVFRLETDYQYQDVEQLRIRMEAFSEMLVQRRYREVRRAS